MKPPFFGTKVITDIKLDDVYPYIDTNSLFIGQWQFKRNQGSEAAYQKLISDKAKPAFEGWKLQCNNEKLLKPKTAYGYFHADSVLKHLNVSIKPAHDFIPLQIVTVGGEVVSKCQWLFAAHQYTDYLYLHGLAVVTTEALAEYCHRRILKELGISFTGSRISPGYKIWPDLSDQKELCKLLDVVKIGIELTETYQLVPEYSTSAMIVL